MYAACIHRVLLYRAVHVCGLYISTVRVRGLITGACGRYAICVMLWFEVGETHANCSIWLLLAVGNTPKCAASLTCS